MWSNLNDSFSAFTGQLNTLRQSIPSMPFTGEEEKARESLTKIFLLKSEVARHRQIAAEYKQRWLQAQELAKSAGASIEGYHDEISLLDDDDVVFEDDESTATFDSNNGQQQQHHQHHHYNDQQVSSREGDSIDAAQNLPSRAPIRLAIPSALTDLRLTASTCRIHELEDEIRKLDADREHWRSLAKQKSHSENEFDDTKNQLKKVTDEYQQCLVSRAELEQQLLELDSQHELTLNTVIQMRDNSVEENVQLRARIQVLEQAVHGFEQQQLAITQTVNCSNEATLQTESENSSKTLNHSDQPICVVPVQHNDESGGQSVSTVESDKIDNDATRPEPDGAASGVDDKSAQVEEIRGRLDAVIAENRKLQVQLDTLQQQSGALQHESQQRCSQLEADVQRLIGSLNEANDSSQLRMKELAEDVAIKQRMIEELQSTIERMQSEVQTNSQNEDRNLEVAAVEVGELKSQLSQTSTEYERVCEQLKQVTTELENTREESEHLKEAMKRMSLLVQQKDHEASTLREQTGQMEVELGSQTNNSQFQESEVQRLELELSRLRQHLVSVEETYTAELVTSTDRCEALEKDLEKLQTDQLSHDSKDEEILALKTARDRAINEASTLEDRVQQYCTSIANLQGVIEQLEKDHERKLQFKAQEIEKRVDAEKQITMGVTKQLKYLEERYRETVQTLEAATRLTQAIEQKDAQINQLKGELKIREEQILQLQSRIIDLELSYEGKVDKQIVKSLVLSYFSTQPGTTQRTEGERLLARFLDFNQTEMEKAGIRIGKNRSDPNDSLVSRFVEFLEHESDKGTTNDNSDSGSRKSSQANLQTIELAKDLNKRLSMSNSLLQPARLVNPFLATSAHSQHQRTPSNVSTASTVSENNIQNQLLAATLQSDTFIPQIELQKTSDMDTV